jgi:phosphoadenosine phosphosulfate reductase
MSAQAFKDLDRSKDVNVEGARERIIGWQQLLETGGAEEILKFAVRQFPGKAVLASSLGMEDQILTAMIAKNQLPIPIFTLDTGRLFQETLDMITITEAQYGIHIQIFSPEAEAVQEMVDIHGANLFRESVELRKRCCSIRKLDPLKKALQGADAWICGLRKEQSITRDEVQIVEWDDTWNLVKFNPLARWDESSLRRYLADHQVPYNPLHDEGYPSIGCSCCTRAVAPGENSRAGRWWWENPEHRECGLHRALPRVALAPAHSP